MNIALFVAGLTALTFVLREDAGLIMNGLISIGVSLAVLGLAFAFERISVKIKEGKE